MRNRPVQLHLKPPSSSWKRAPLSLPSGPKQELFRLRMKRLVDGSSINGQTAAMLTLMTAMATARGSKLPGFTLRRIFEICYPSVFLQDPKVKGDETGLVDEAIEAFALAKEWTPGETLGEIVMALVREAKKLGAKRDALMAVVEAAWDE